MEPPIKRGYAKFIGVNGYPNELEEALKTLVVGKEYKVISGSMGQSRTTLTLDGVHGSWNSVMFELDYDTCPIDESYFPRI